MAPTNEREMLEELRNFDAPSITNIVAMRAIFGGQIFGGQSYAAENEK